MANSSAGKRKKQLLPVSSLFILLLLAGCSVNWYDERTGTQHLLGFGYLKMRAAPQSPETNISTHASMAYVTGTRNLGLQLGAGSDFAGISAGWDSRSRIIIKSEDAYFSLMWPTNSIWLPFGLGGFFNVYVGTNFPFMTPSQ